MGGKFNEGKYIWAMPNGGRVSFRYLETVSDADEYQGRNLTDAWVEEMGQYASSEPIDRLFAVLRSAHGVPVQLIGTGNPGGVGQHWIAERYGLIPFPDGPRKHERVLANGNVHQYITIPSRISDNKILLNSDPKYIDRLHLVGGDALVRAWLDGDWTAIEGAYFDGWSSRNVIRPFKIPDYWNRFRSFDWGYAAPFSVGWWAVASDDFEVEEGVIPINSLVRYREWYGASGPNKGIRMEAEDIAKGILEREAKGENVRQLGPADPSVFATDRGPSIAERMFKAGVKWTKADNRRVGQRGMIGGWDQMRSRIKGIETHAGQRPLIYTFDTCKDSIRTIPVLQHDEKRPEDLDTDGEDHAADEWRYMCMSRPLKSDVPAVEADNTWAAPTAAQVEARFGR